MSANNTGIGGVRNLRAIFENRSSDLSTSPPSRGRSPNSSDLSGSSRPVSKVRTSFIAVDKPGDFGQIPPLGVRKAGELDNMAEVKGKAQPTSTKTAMPSSAHVSKHSIDGGLGTILKGSAFESVESSGKGTETKTLAQAMNNSKGHTTTPVPIKANGDASKAAGMVKKMQASQEKPQPPPATKLKTTTGAQIAKPLPTRQMPSKAAPTSPAVTKQTPKGSTSPPSPAMLKIRGGPAKIKGVMASASKAKEDRELLARARDVEPKSQAESQQKSKSSSTTKDKTPAVAAKPAPKSPSKPAKLPSAATAVTASSAAKADPQPAAEADRRRSLATRTSTASLRQSKATTAATASTLAKKSSRVSLANGNERPRSRVSTGKPDDSFLARMTRPTASTAQKVHDKTSVNSPPRSRTSSGPKQGTTNKSKSSRMSLKPHHNGENKGDAPSEKGPGSPLNAVKESPAQDPTVKAETAVSSSTTTTTNNQISQPPRQAEVPGTAHDAATSS